MENLVDGRVLIGMMGASSSMLMSHISDIGAIIIACLTALYMFEKWRKERISRKKMEEEYGDK